MSSVTPRPRLEAFVPDDPGFSRTPWRWGLWGGARTLPAALLGVLLLSACQEPPELWEEAPLPEAEALAEETGLPPRTVDRILEIHARTPFADIHAHPSRFHRGEAERITGEELDLYRRGRIDVVAAKVSSDAAFGGGYVRRDGTEVPREPQDPEPGYPFAFMVDRLERVLLTVEEEDDVILARSPGEVRAARQEGRIALLPSLEGADGLEGSLENLRAVHEMGVGMVQLVHFRVNELGHIQTDPTPGGLTDFGRDVVEEMNRLGMIVDLAHANTETILDVLEVSRHPVVFSHTGVNALQEAARHLADDEIRAIAEAGGVVGIWPNGSQIPDLETMVAHIDHVREVAGIDHVAIGSDLRGMSRYTEGFGSEANFMAVAAALLDAGFTDEEVGKVMGGNFFRVWEEVAGSRGVAGGT